MPINFQSSSSTTKPTTYSIWLLLLALIFIAALYMTIKLIINFKRSITKTKQILKEELVIKYVQGLSPKSNAFFNILIINATWIAMIIVSSIMISKTIKANNNTYVAFIAITLLAFFAICAFNISLFILHIYGFNSPQYKHNKNDLFLELESLRSQKVNLISNYPDKIKIDVEKISQSNPLAPRVLTNYLNYYNTKINSSEISLIKKYKEYLNEIFKIDFFIESLETIEKQQEMQQNMLGYNQPENNDSLSKVEKEIIWMDRMDKKVKLMKETEHFDKVDKKEFAKKYDEYLYTVRSQDPVYQNIQKNTWLTYRDGDIEDLFYNPNSTIIYTLDNGQSANEKSLADFLKEYKEYLVAKFYSLDFK
ncbi:hypothetical protein [Metamycoplasma equirhinis]|uniref:hypothetical protein n=1 Tax=Metamycoplasma equirhinis TaxID=92402 RepID=UPI0035933E1E